MWRAALVCAGGLVLWIGFRSRAAFLARETYYYNTYLLRRALGARIP